MDKPLGSDQDPITVTAQVRKATNDQSMDFDSFDKEPMADESDYYSLIEPQNDADAFIQGLEDRSKMFNRTEEMMYHREGSHPLHNRHYEHKQTPKALSKRESGGPISSRQKPEPPISPPVSHTSSSSEPFK